LHGGFLGIFVPEYAEMFVFFQSDTTDEAGAGELAAQVLIAMPHQIEARLLIPV
jgi:cytochrome c-type biogenesis protein CcmH/NrfG